MKNSLCTAAAALLLVLAVPAWADQHPPQGQHERERDSRIVTRGHIRSVVRQRDGYRVYLDRGNYSYWVPASALGRRQLRVGVELRLGGVFRDGYVYVDAIGWPGDPYFDDENYGYGDRYTARLSGRVERVNFRTNTLILREARTGRTIEVRMRLTEHRRGVDFGDLRRGDRITLVGQWDHNDFNAFRIESVETR